MSDLNSWAISKQYLAAHYYLSEERPISISEAQRAQLGALHLHVSFGVYNDSILVPDLINCTSNERKKRVSEWKKLGSISRVTAMKKFIDLISSLFPNWQRFRKLYYEFEQEWANMPEITLQEKIQKPKSENFYRKKKDRKEIEFRETTPNAFKKIFEMKKEKNLRAKSRIIERNESPEILLKKEIPKQEIKSQLPKINNSLRQYKEKSEDFLKEFIEDLQSHRGGNLRNSSATKFPKNFERVKFDHVKYSTPDVDSKKEMNEFRKKLITDEFSKIQEKNKKMNFQQKNIIPSLLDKIAEMKQVLKTIEDDYNNINA